jgi:Rrf2 family protein
MASCRFAFAVHILAVLAYKGAREVTSDLLASSVNTNAVVVRRLLSELRLAGLVTTVKGAGGGARLSRSPDTITLAEIYRAVVHGPSFSHHPHPPNPRCPVGGKIEEVLGEIFTQAQTALEANLAERTLGGVLEEVMDHSPEAALGVSPANR